jgi:hypothetical protein
MDYLKITLFHINHLRKIMKTENSNTGLYPIGFWTSNIRKYV